MEDNKSEGLFVIIFGILFVFILVTGEHLMDHKAEIEILKERVKKLEQREIF